MSSSATPLNSPSRLSPAGHSVQFYERDEFLIATLAAFVSEGLCAGETVILLITSAHRKALESALIAVGVDLPAQQRIGAYLAIDAAEALARIQSHGAPDRALFERHVATLVQSRRAQGSTVRIFGELVALLCEQGRHQAAIQLEGYWNDLSTRCDFQLVCGYPVRAFAGSEAAEAFHAVCQAHHAVRPAETVRATTAHTGEQLRTIASLQRDSAALKAEIAERRKVEQILRRREEELTSFVETAPVGLHWVGADGTILWANAAELRLLGYPAEEYIGRNIAEFHVDQEVLQDILSRLTCGETLRGREARMRCKDGSIKSVMIDSSVYWEDGRFVHTQCFTRDLTDRNASERSNALLAAIVESSDDAIVSKDLTSIITSWNKGAERIFGYTSDEIVGQSVLRLIPPELQHEEDHILSRLRRGERVEHYETVRVRKNGERIHVSLTVSPVRGRDGRVIGASKVARDITDRVRSERALRAAQEELARVNEELERRVQERTASLRDAVGQMEEFSYTVSHDLRAPLRAMRGYGEALLEEYGPALPAPARHYLERIAENANRLDRMVKDVLKYSRISRAELTIGRISLDRLARQVVNDLPGLQASRAEIRIKSLADVAGHEPSVVQILTNLISNAVKFVAPGVRPSVTLRTEASGTNVRLWVEDNGIGIKPEFHNRLFGMFERLHPDASYDGMGVGLAIVRKAALRMGGSVGVESDGEHGSRFWVELPAATDSLAPKPGA